MRAQIIGQLSMSENSPQSHHCFGFHVFISTEGWIRESLRPFRLNKNSFRNPLHIVKPARWSTDSIIVGKTFGLRNAVKREATSVDSSLSMSSTTFTYHFDPVRTMTPSDSTIPALIEWFSTCFDSLAAIKPLASLKRCEL